MEPPRRTVFDKLVDGETVTMTDNDGRVLGYLMGWTDPEIPVVARAEVELRAERMELEAWRDLVRDQRRRLPANGVLILWDGLPLAVWLPTSLYPSIAN